jgi:DNA-binding NarL/FixJ family response regulator
VSVLVLTVHAEEEYLVPVVDAGASGYLTKASADRDLVDAIHVVARGEVYLPARAATLLLQQYRKAERAGAGDPGHPGAESREREVLALTAEGYSSTEIGQKLFISPKTVDTYRSRIMQKLGLNHRSELVRFRFGWASSFRIMQKLRLNHRSELVRFALRVEVRLEVDTRADPARPRTRSGPSWRATVTG